MTEARRAHRHGLLLAGGRRSVFSRRRCRFFVVIFCKSQVSETISVIRWDGLGWSAVIFRVVKIALDEGYSLDITASIVEISRMKSIFNVAFITL